MFVIKSAHREFGDYWPSSQKGRSGTGRTCDFNGGGAVPTHVDWKPSLQH